MANNTKKGYRVGPVAGREQYQEPDGTWVKVDENGKVRGAKQGAPFKGVRKR